ncbi:MAG: tRNA pseudouridine38-40 synthase [Actinomycetota bacterium]|nr:tRNA pseudouridine38-40 synthase [Actinomycetota bacterium]
MGGPFTTEVAGRTDAGVHALGQVVTVAPAPDDIDPESVKKSLNKLCAPSISVHSVIPVSEDFSARSSARSRTYVYAILISDVPHPFRDATCWRIRSDLDVEAMNEAAGHLLGVHDFSSFGRTREPDASAVRNLFELNATKEGNLVRIKARASSFIQQMVRSLAGTLADVGAGKIDPGEMPQVLEGRDRKLAGRVAPPHGLCLVSAEYDEGWSRPV